MKNYARKRWSDEDDQFLIDNADSMTISDAASALNRTYSSIQQRAARIGVKLIESDKNNKLTQEDVRFIVENGDTMTVSENGVCSVAVNTDDRERCGTTRSHD